MKGKVFATSVGGQQNQVLQIANIKFEYLLSVKKTHQPGNL